MVDGENGSDNMKGRQPQAMLDFVSQNEEFEIYFKCKGKPFDMFEWMEETFDI